MKSSPSSWPAESYLTVDEAARILGRHPEQVRRYIREGRFAGAVKVGLMWYIPRAEAAAYATRLRTGRGHPADAGGAA